MEFNKCKHCGRKFQRIADGQELEGDECGTCRKSQHCDQCEFCDILSKEHEFGLCRFNPPERVYDLAKVGKINIKKTPVMWPPVSIKKDWCGKFQQK